MNSVFARTDAKQPDVGNDRIPEIKTDAVLNRILEVDSPSNIESRFRKNEHLLFHRLIKRAWSSSTVSQVALLESMISERSAKTLPCQSGMGSRFHPWKKIPTKAPCLRLAHTMTIEKFNP
jgi:hypothetical protein